MNHRLIFLLTSTLALSCSDEAVPLDMASADDGAGDLGSDEGAPADDGGADDGGADDGGADDGGADDGGADDGGADDGGTGRRDIRGAVFADRSGDCADYAASTQARAEDVQRVRAFLGLVDVLVGEETCTLVSNAIPNHDFNQAGARFNAADVTELEGTWVLPRGPSFAAAPSPLTLNSYDAVMLNGVVLDQLAAGCFGVGDGRVGCNDLAAPYRYDPLSPEAGFFPDAHNAHTQPDGRYHYHGDPLAMYGEAEDGPSGVIGFAADGFPIYGPYFDDGTEVREAASGYTLRTGTRPGGPGGRYDGAFRDDYEFTNAGDLDECNGMTVDGQYGYYVTRRFPWVVSCFRGTPDPSFRKRG
ncbi:MAG: YHYH protein [Myxococcota bacterium]